MTIAKPNRIKKEADFQRIIKIHDSVANRFFILYKNESNELKHWKLGLSVSKKIGKAHERVWVKRRIRASIMNLNDQIPNNLELIVIARPITNGLSQAEIEKNIKHVLKLAGVINE
jgi:ribonuclease P protein component